MVDRDECGTDHGGEGARRAGAGVPVDAADEHPSRSGTPADGQTEPDPPAVVATVGQAGVYLAVGSVGLAVVGTGAIAAGVQPHGNVVTVLALAGVTVAMVLGMAHQAYVGDWTGQ